MRVVLIANPGSLRAVGFTRALTDAGYGAPEVVGWRDVIEGRGDLETRARGAIVRLDAAGEDAQTQRAILTRGARERLPQTAERLTPAAIDEIAHDPGRIGGIAQYAAGYEAVLRDLALRLDRTATRAVLNPPRDVALLTSKPACSEHLRRFCVPVAPHLEAVWSYDALREAMRRRGWSRVFIKPTHGSSAAGVIALETQRDRVQAHAAIEITTPPSHPTPRLYQNRRVRRIRDASLVSTLIDAIAREGVHVERWIPKASLPGGTFDLRILTIAGEPAHAVARVARGPLTNLHLGNERRPIDAVRARLGETRWEALCATCRRVAAAFPESLHLGIDVLITASWRHHVVAEVNAFGDLLHDVRLHGRTPQEAQIAALTARFAKPVPATNPHACSQPSCPPRDLPRRHGPRHA